MSVAAIYGRKSLFTGRGESVKNQMDACKEYALKRKWEVIEYFDEGFSGKDTDRPGFQKLLQDIQQKKIDHVIFYKLDRISRRMLDILDFIELTNKQGVDFISITENFDTTTPLGRAMVHIAATFAQLEREILQQRVRDNMIRLAKTGRWLGGVTPTGYKAKQIEYLDAYGKTKYKYILEGIPRELNIVQTIFRKYLELKSLQQVEKYLNSNHIKTKKNNHFKKQTIKAILTNPVYIKADSLAFEYFSNLNIDIANSVEEFDGVYGVLTYNKNIIRKGYANELRDYDQWILAIGNHKGIISSRDWIEAQNLLDRNRKKHPRQLKSKNALLTGLLFCKCGSMMKVKYGGISQKTGKRLYYYVCTNKNTNSNICNAANIRGDMLDNIIFNAIKKIPYDADYILSYIEKAEQQYNNMTQINNCRIKALRTAIHEKEINIRHLVTQLESNISPQVLKRIQARIEKLDQEINECYKEMQLISTKHHEINIDNILLDILKKKIKYLPSIIENIDDISKKKNLLTEIVAKIIWHNDKIEIYTI